MAINKVKQPQINVYPGPQERFVEAVQHIAFLLVCV